MDKKIIDKEFGEITLRRRLNYKRLSIHVRSGGKVSIALPHIMTYKQAIDFFEQKREEIRNIIKKLDKSTNSNDQRIPHIKDPIEVEKMRRFAEQSLTPRVINYAIKYNLQFVNLRFKNNTSNWGSCSNIGNINLNIKLIYLPEHLQDYIILHELAHLKHQNHGPHFHTLLNNMLLDSLQSTEDELVREIKRYKFSR